MRRPATCPPPGASQEEDINLDLADPEDLEIGEVKLQKASQLGVFQGVRVIGVAAKLVEEMRNALFLDRLGRIREMQRHLAEIFFGLAPIHQFKRKVGLARVEETGAGGGQSGADFLIHYAFFFLGVTGLATVTLSTCFSRATRTAGLSVVKKWRWVRFSISAGEVRNLVQSRPVFC